MGVLEQRQRAETAKVIGLVGVQHVLHHARFHAGGSSTTTASRMQNYLEDLGRLYRHDVLVAQ
jgi:hypothetical protein